MGAGVSLLADLNLQDCQKLTNISLHYTSQGLRITAINLSFCANISDSSLKSAARMATLPPSTSAAATTSETSGCSGAARRRGCRVRGKRHQEALRQHGGGEGGSLII